MAKVNDGFKLSVGSLRKRFFEEIDELEENEFVEADLQRLRTDDQYCERFLIHNQGDIGKSLNMIKESFKWRKEFGVDNIKETSLPRELLEIGALYPFNHDKNNNPILILEVKLHLKNAHLAEEQKRGFVFGVEKMLKERAPNGTLTFVFDCQDAGYSNFDLDLAIFVNNVFLKYYPASVAYCLVYAMPWLFDALWKIIKPLVPKHARKRIAFVNEKTIKDYIDEEYLPIRMGGKDESVYKYIPGQWN